MVKRKWRTNQKKSAKHYVKKLKIAQHEHYIKLRINSGSLERNINLILSQPVFVLTP